MTVVNPKSISGITSITTASGSDNLLTIHTNNGTERLRVDSTGATKIVTGIITTLNATESATVGTGITLSPDGNVFSTGVTTCLGSGLFGNAIIGGGTTITADGVNAGIITATDLISKDATPSLRLEDSENGYYAFLDGNSGNLVLHSDKGNSGSTSTMKFAVDNSTKMTLNADGELGINETSPDTKLTVKGGDVGTTATNQTDSLKLTNISSNVNQLIFGSRRLSNGSDWTTTTERIQRRIDVTKMGYIDFGRASAGYEVVIGNENQGDVLEINSGGNVTVTDGDIVFASGHGINFSATAQATNASSEVFHDYEEGTFTPAFKAGNNSSNATTTVNEAQYTKIGDTVFVRLYITLSAHASGTTGGSAFINGLPFTNVAGHSACSVGYFATWVQNQMFVTGTVQPSSNQLLFRHNISASTATATMDYDNNLQPGSVVILSATYQTAA